MVMGTDRMVIDCTCMLHILLIYPYWIDYCLFSPFTQVTTSSIHTYTWPRNFISFHFLPVETELLLAILVVTAGCRRSIITAIFAMREVRFEPDPALVVVEVPGG